MAMFNYEPTKDGVITAIRIYYGKNRTPMADLAFCFGGKVTIEWTNVTHRNTYQKGINGYTFIFDEREKNDFDSFVKNVNVNVINDYYMKIETDNIKIEYKWDDKTERELCKEQIERIENLFKNGYNKGDIWQDDNEKHVMGFFKVV